ncbi:hypothetical protein [Thiomonas sp. FB-Cd]|uniref:hypothetical protein n=1 Tax=Thiomonas sp. FB-Cd TaxID=1158292 RepID=UPI0004DF0164|nr:hypothetical protein [Thiomonas sp. FB-Cd]
MNPSATAGLPQALRLFLARISHHWRKPVDRTAFSQTGPMDRRTIMLPMIGNQQGKSYYEVAEMWARERLRAKRHLQEILDGTIDSGDPDHAASSFACELGIWLRFVDMPGIAHTIDDLRMWHDHWHQELARLIDLANQAERTAVDTAMKPGRGPWAYASRRVTQLLEALWVDKAPIALKLQLPTAEGNWIDAVLLQEYEQGARLTISLETNLSAGMKVGVRDVTKPEGSVRDYRVKLCRLGQRGPQDEGLLIAYLVG